MSNEVAVRQDAVPDYLKNYHGSTGTEGLGTQDLNIPRIKLAQGLSPVVQQGKAKEGDLYLNITEEPLTDPLVIVPLIASKEFLLWRNRDDEGGGVMARATLGDDGLFHWDKPNTTFETTYGKPPKKVKYTTDGAFDQGDAEGLHVWGTAFPDDPDSPPAASLHYNYIVMLPEHDGMIAGLSLSKTQVVRAKNFNALLMLGNAPIYARKFVVTTENDKRGNHTFKNYRFRAAGFVDEATMLNNKDIIDSFQGVNVTFDESSDEKEKDVF